MENAMDRNISLFSESAWDALEALLRRRLLIPSKLSEEDLRYCVVEALESCGMFPKGAIQLNFEHPAFQGKRIDVFLPSYSGQDAIACELKYDRALPSGHNQPRSMKSGSVSQRHSEASALQSDLARGAVLDLSYGSRNVCLCPQHRKRLCVTLQRPRNANLSGHPRVLK